MVELEEIRALLYRVCYANDERDAALWESCWTEDAEMGGGSRTEVASGKGNVFRGRAAITAALTHAWKRQTQRRRHVLSNIFLIDEGEAGGDEATVNSYITLYLIEDEGRPKLDITGSYRDHVVRVNCEWKIQKRHAVMDSVYQPGDID